MKGISFASVSLLVTIVWFAANPKADIITIQQDLGSYKRVVQIKVVASKSGINCQPINRT